MIPVRYTCRGSDVSPPLQWQDIPHGTQSLALIVEDADASEPGEPDSAWVHWLVYNLPPNCQQLGEGIQPSTLPKGAQLGLNDWKAVDYCGPCLVNGRHHYRYTLYALDTVLPNLGNVSKRKLFKLMQPHILATSKLIGVFESNT